MDVLDTSSSGAPVGRTPSQTSFEDLHRLREHLDAAGVALLPHVRNVLRIDGGGYPSPGHAQHRAEEHDEEHDQQQRRTAAARSRGIHGFFGTVKLQVRVRVRVPWGG